MKTNKKIILKNLFLISTFFYFGCLNNKDSKSDVKQIKEITDDENTFELYYMPTDEKLVIDIAYLKLYSRIYNSPLVNYAAVLPHLNCNKNNLNNLKIFLENDSLFIEEDYSNGLLIKRYTPCMDSRFYEYQYFEYDAYNRLKHYYNKNDDGEFKNANERCYEYYQDAQGRIYQFEITDRLGATEINKTSQVFIQTKTDYGFMIEEIHSFSVDMRELNYDALPDKLNRNIFFIKTENGKITSIVKNEQVYNTVFKIQINYTDELVNRIIYEEYQNSNKLFEEIINYKFENNYLTKEQHKQTKFGNTYKEYSFEFTYSDFDGFGNFKKQFFHGRTKDFDNVHIPMDEKDTSEKEIIWDWSYK